jgi:4-oxalocrotonate tautomerase
MPVLRVSMYKGRTLEQKRELAEALTEVMVRVAKTTAQGTVIICEEVDKENWASSGTLASDKG